MRQKAYLHILYFAIIAGIALIVLQAYDVSNIAKNEIRLLNRDTIYVPYQPIHQIPQNDMWVVGPPQKVYITKYKKDTVHCDTSAYIQQINSLKAQNKIANELLLIEQQNSDSLYKIQQEFIQEVNLLTQLLKNEKENRDAITSSLKIRHGLNPGVKYLHPLQSVSVGLMHIGNYPWLPSNPEETMDQIRIKVAYSRALNDRLMWGMSASLDVYNRYDQFSKSLGLEWFYTYNFY
jgi:hypothetical protein